jgi:thiol peroxidase
MPASVERITISRDLPFAQKRLAKEHKFTGIRFLSDYREGDFGRSVGLLQEDSLLLTRAVILVDKKGIVRYIQVVPEVTTLPDMERAFDEATKLAAE